MRLKYYEAMLLIDGKEVCQEVYAVSLAEAAKLVQHTVDVFKTSGSAAARVLSVTYPAAQVFESLPRGL